MHGNREVRMDNVSAKWTHLVGELTIDCCEPCVCTRKLRVKTFQNYHAKMPYAFHALVLYGARLFSNHALESSCASLWEIP